MAVLIQVDGSRLQVDGLNNGKFPLEQMQKLVGGDIEHIKAPESLRPYKDPDTMGKLVLADMDGSMKMLKINEEASRLVGFPLRGPGLFISQEEME